LGTALIDLRSGIAALTFMTIRPGQEHSIPLRTSRSHRLSPVPRFS